jgi:diadenosine tetraphosphate (Ap4A) HIT family hydrolase
MEETLRPRAVAYIAHGSGVPHVHLHLIPLTERDEISDPIKYMQRLSDTELKSQADRLRELLPFRHLRL